MAKMAKDHLKIILFICFLSAAAGVILWSNRQLTVTRGFFAMGTAFEITATGKNPEQAIDAARQEIDRIERLTGYAAGSDIDKLNRNAGVAPITVSSETLEILKIIDTYYQELSGTFDPSVAPLIELWGFGTERTPDLPTPEAIRRLQPLVNFKNVRINYQTKKVFLPQAGMKLDLGGIAKGYAIDRAYNVLRKHGITSALINGGSSSIRVIGSKNASIPWNLGIGHPRRSEQLVGTLRLPGDRALGTSADTQNFFIKDGIRYSHLINPHTGYPAREKMLVTATAPTAVMADLLSTAFFILPASKINAFIKNHPTIGAITVSSDNRITVFNEPRFAKISNSP